MIPTLNAAFADAYPDSPARLRIEVASTLLNRSRLVELAQFLPPDLVEFNPGDLPISVSPDKVPEADLSASETIEKIGQVNSWMTLRNIERDPAYRALSFGLIDDFAGQILPKTGEIQRREAFLFISSPGAVTPFHIDEEHNILIQVEGRKTVTVYSQHDRDLASQIDLERFHSGAHRNLTLDPALADRGAPVEMGPGDALYIPPLAPHHVKVTGDEPSLSLSITWRSNASRRTCYLHQINHRLRAGGAKPPFPGAAPVRDQLQIWRASAMARVQGLFSGRRA